MRVWTVHTRPDDAPVLVREGFSWGALIFGPLWLLARRAWIPGVLAFCVWIAASALLPDGPRTLLLLALAWLLGLCGWDLVRWSLERRGFLLAHVVAAPSVDDALARLLARRPDLVAKVVP